MGSKHKWHDPLRGPSALQRCSRGRLVSRLVSRRDRRKALFSHIFSRNFRRGLASSSSPEQTLLSLVSWAAFAFAIRGCPRNFGQIFCALPIAVELYNIFWKYEQFDDIVAWELWP